MEVLGKADPEQALQFADSNPSIVLGSFSADGTRRVLTKSVGAKLTEEREVFSTIAAEKKKPQSLPVIVNEQFSCTHRGSKRSTCCGSPELWICRHYNSDCVGNDSDGARLRQMVGTDEAAAVRSCQSCPDRVDPSKRTIPASLGHSGIAVVIPCHNYARFLGDCLKSLMDSTVRPAQIIVVDDASDDNPKAVCDQFEGVEYLRCEERDVHAARGVGLQRVNSRYVCFLDADDKVLPGYFAESLSIFESDRRIAITFTKLEYFGDATGPAHGTDRAPDEVTFENIEQRNWISAGAVLRTELVHQSLVFRGLKIDGQKCWTQDWAVAKAILRSGTSWIAKRMATPLMYRKHGDNMSSRPNLDYWYDADFPNETITIVIAFSGRWDCWPRLLGWLKSQSWPVSQLRLMIINATHRPLTSKMLGLEEWAGSLQIERLDAGYPRLADQERRNQPAIGRAVEAAVASIYNTAIRLLGTEYVVFIEDDVIPRSVDTIEQLLRSMGPWVAGVSGVYRQRYQTDKCCAFDIPFLGDSSFKSLAGEGVEVVGGSGFGCLLTRRSLLRRFPLAGDGSGRFFDCDFGLNCSTADNGWWKWFLNRNVQCDHLLSEVGEVDSTKKVEPESEGFCIGPVAFDFGGTLRVQDGIPGLRDLVGVLNRAGVPCIVVSAIEEGASTHFALNEIAGWTSSDGTRLQFSDVQFVRYSQPATESELYQVGLKKADVMRSAGAQIIFDDLEIVCRAVTDSGLEAVNVSRAKPRSVAPIAFDYGGTLRVSDGVPALRDMVHRLNQTGVPVIIVSAISEGYPTEGIEQEIRELTSSTGESLCFASVQFVYYPYPFTEQDIYEAGLKKAAVMKQFGATLMLDDSGHVCRAVNDSGLLAVRIAAK